MCNRGRQVVVSDGVYLTGKLILKSNVELHIAAGGVWLPTTYMALRGMSEYGFHKEAYAAARLVLD